MIEGVDIKIKRSSRKTISIYVERDGKVSVLAPEHLSDEELNKAIQSKEYLIYKHLTEWKELNQAKKDREWVNGQSFLYLGINYRLNYVSDQKDSLVLRNGFFQLRSDQKQRAKELFIGFYKEKGKPRIENRVNYFKKKLGVEPEQVRVLELKNRWASCSEKGNLNFHWKCIMAPAQVLDYIIVHELVHLIYKNHTPSFWNEVDKIIPDYRKKMEWLRENGAGMDL